MKESKGFSTRWQNNANIAQRLSETRRKSQANLSKNTPEKLQSNHTFALQDSKMFPGWYHKGLHVETSPGSSSNIQSWLLSTGKEFERHRRKDRRASFESCSVSSSVSSSNTDCSKDTGCDSCTSTYHNPKFDQLSATLIQEAHKSQCKVADVFWDLQQCNAFIQVDKTLFPIDVNFVSYVSDFFQSILGEKVDEREKQIIYRVDGYETDEISTILQFVYSSNSENISDENVAALLQLSREFKVPRLRYQCEHYLKNSTTFNPTITLHLARQYKLTSLLEHSYVELSKVKGIEDTLEFASLDLKSQNKILKYALKRYHNASEAMTQFDVHLCNYHGNEPKHSQCCFRAATYNVEGERTFLVQMENPEKRLVQCYDTAFSCQLH